MVNMRVSLILLLPLLAAGQGVVEWKPGEFGAKLPPGWTVAGQPKVVDSPFGKAMAFDGKADGMFFHANPAQGLAEFTVEAVFRPDSDGPPEQRFVHMGYPNADRILLEIRVTKEGQWYLDTYLMGGKGGGAMIDPKLTHTADRWCHAALVVKDGHMTNYVNGVKQEEGGAAGYVPIQGGESSIGIRLNRQSPFKGAIYSVRVTPKALDPSSFTHAKP
jgi:hypothetical protein